MKTEGELINLLAQSMEALLAEFHAGTWNENVFGEACNCLRELASLWRGIDRVPRRVVPVVLGSVDNILSRCADLQDADLRHELQEKAVVLEELIAACFVDPGDNQEFRLLRQ